MAITIREDESEAGGFALIDLGRAIESDPIRLAFRRQDGESRYLGLEGWQPEAAWLAADRMPGQGSTAVLRVGPTVVDWIDELIPVEITAEGVGPLGVVVWPHLTRSPRRLTELRIGAVAPRAQAPVPPPAPPPRPEPTPPRIPEAAPVRAPPPPVEPKQPAPAPAAPPIKRSKWRIASRAIATVVALAALAAPFALARLGYYGLVVEASGPLDFVEGAPSAGSATKFTPASTVLEIRRAGWARWFEGWLLKDPPPAAPIAEASWLAVRPADQQTDVIRFSIVPEPRAFPSGVRRLQTTVSVRNTGSGVVTEPTAVTLRRAPGKPQIQAAAPVAFKGVQGGPMEPRQIALRLSALGLGFHWSTEGAVPGWIELTPSQGELGDNASVEIIAKPRPTASTLAPGRYEGQVIFRNAQSGDLAEQVVQLVVDPRPPPPPGRLVVEHPSPLQFSGPQGGPFLPRSVPLTVKAVGTGFKWAAEGVPQWLELTPAQGELRDNTSANIVAAPRQSAQAMKPGTYEGQFIVRKVGSGDTVTQTAQLVVGPPVGQLRIDAAGPVVFAGPQGGPFAPGRATLQLKAVGNGFEWSAEAASFVQVSPAQGRIGDNESVEIEVKPAPAAQALTPGSYSAGLTFKKKESGEPTVHPVRLIVRLSF